MFELDITVFCLEQHIPLPLNHFELHQSQKDFFPDWQTHLKTASAFRVLEYQNESPLHQSSSASMVAKN
jgi:hypothetical protein